MSEDMFIRVQTKLAVSRCFMPIHRSRKRGSDIVGPGLRLESNLIFRFLTIGCPCPPLIFPTRTTTTGALRLQWGISIVYTEWSGASNSPCEPVLLFSNKESD